MRSLPKAAISSNLWPDAAKSFSACAGLKVIDILRPCVSLNSASARSMEGCARLSDMRDQGMSIEAGLGVLMTPITPACLRDFQPSPMVWEWAERAVGVSDGEPARYTTTLPVRSAAGR